MEVVIYVYLVQWGANAFRIRQKGYMTAYAYWAPAKLEVKLTITGNSQVLTLQRGKQKQKKKA